MVKRVSHQQEEERRVVMTLYEIIQAMGKAHCRIKGVGCFADLMRFNLTDKTIYNGNFILMKRGEPIEQQIKLSNGQTFKVTKNIKLLPDDLYKCNFKERLEELYEQFYNSCPNKHSMYAKPNFIENDSKTASVLQLAQATDKIETQYELEAFILLSSLVRDLPKELDMQDKHFFWRSEQSKLRLYRDWI